MKRFAVLALAVSLAGSLLACEATANSAKTSSAPLNAQKTAVAAPKPTKTPMPKTGEKAAATKAAKPPKAASAATQEQLDEFQRLIKDLNITGEQAARINARRDAALKGFGELEASPEGQRQKAAREKRDALKGSTDAAKLAEAEKEWKDAHAAYMAKRGALRAAVFNELTAEQKLAYTRMRFMNDITRTFSRAELTDEQIAKIKPLSDKAAEAFLKPDTFTSDPYLMGIKEARVPVEEEVRAKILTPEQREKTAPKPKATAPTTAKK